MRVDTLLKAAAGLGASDLHVTAGALPRVRVDGALRVHEGAAVTRFEIDEWLESELSADQLQTLHHDRAVDFGLTVEGAGRFRVNAFFQANSLALAVRKLPDEILSVKGLGLPAFVESLSSLVSGLVIVTGPTGSGKTTTLAALIKRINEKRACHILTIEDPVEFLFESGMSLVHQREVHSDTPDFASAVRAAMREDPDVVLVGEMRDLPTMRAALMAAETGHLVFTTLHTPDAVGVLDRLVGSFPGDEQASIRQQLSMVLRVVVAQQLLPGKSGGRVPVVEILVVNSAVSHLIRTVKSQQLSSVLETSGEQGMQAVDHALARVVASGEVLIEDAEPLCRNRGLFRELVGRDPGGV